MNLMLSIATYCEFVVVNAVHEDTYACWSPRHKYDPKIYVIIQILNKESLVESISKPYLLSEGLYSYSFAEYTISKFRWTIK